MVLGDTCGLLRYIDHRRYHAIDAAATKHRRLAIHPGKQRRIGWRIQSANVDVLRYVRAGHAGSGAAILLSYG
jgi:hypothetical protein